MKNHISKFSVVSLATAMILGMTGCSDDAAPASTTTTVTGSAVDGYLRGAAVCLDLDANNLCSVAEPSTFTGVDGSYTFTITAEHKAHNGFAAAKLIVFGGEDSDTGKNFVGKLVSEFDVATPTDVFITPLTTMTSAMIQSDSTLTKDEAEAKVAALTGLTVAQVTSDPIAAAVAGNTDVLSKALEIHKAVEVLAATSTDDAKTATENVYLALAEGSKTATTTSVSAMLTNADTATLGADATAVLDAAVVLAQNVALAVSNMETGVDSSLAIAAVANTVDKVKTLVDADVTAYTGGTFTSTVTTTAAADTANVVTSVTVNNVIVNNVINNTVTVTLTDAQLQAILAAMVGTDLTLEAINDALVVAATTDTSLTTVSDAIDTQVEEDAAEQAILDSVDTSVTMKSVLEGVGFFWAEIWNNGTTLETEAGRVTVDAAGVITHHKLNADGTYTANSSDGDMILVDGVWVSEDDGSFTFDAAGDLIIDTPYENIKLSIGASFDIAGKDIALMGAIEDTSALSALVGTFSAGAKYYEVMVTELSFTPAYELGYWESTWDDATQTDIETPGVNQNIVRDWSNGGADVLTIADFKTRFLDTGVTFYGFYNEDIDQGLGATLETGGVLNLFDQNTGAALTPGTWAEVTVGTTNILVFTIPDQYMDSEMSGTAKHIMAEEGGFLREGEYLYASDSTGEMWVSFNEIAALDIVTAATATTTTLAPSLVSSTTNELDASDAYNKAHRASKRHY